MSDPTSVLLAALSKRASSDAMAWLDKTGSVLEAGASERKFFMAYSSVARHFDHEPLGEIDGEGAREGWRPSRWMQSEAARAIVLRSVKTTDADSYRALCDKLCSAADAVEIVAFYRALPVLPFPEVHVARAAEGVRTNMSSVFRAVAHDNPYPCERFDEIAWNTMVLKALFIQVPLAPMVGLDRRANPTLMRMLCDYAHERWAASRAVSPELWRCVGPYADDAALADLRRVIETGNEEERQAAEDALRAYDARGDN